MKLVEANLWKLQQKEMEKQRLEESRAAKLRAEREEKEKEREAQQKAREEKMAEVKAREEQQRLVEEQRRLEVERRREEQDAQAGFYNTKHLNLKGKGKGMGKGELQRLRREEEMERRAREALGNIGRKAQKEEGSDSERAVKGKGGKGKVEVGGKGLQKGEDSEEATGKGKDGKGKEVKVRVKEKKKPTWWKTIDGDCPISLVPIAELPVPPFCLKAEGSSVPHYFDGRFLASFLLSSFDFINPVNRTPLSREDCLALDAHLRDHHPRDRPSSVADAFELFQRNGGSGSDAVRREATAVFQHLFRFAHAQSSDSRGRAINYNDGGLTVTQPK